MKDNIFLTPEEAMVKTEHMLVLKQLFLLMENLQNLVLP